MDRFKVAASLAFISFLGYVTFVVATAHGENLCRAPYALTHEKFNYPAYKKSLEGVENYSVAVLWTTFGNKLSNLEKELSDPHVKGIEVHLINGSCLKNNRCGKYEVVTGNHADFQKKVRKKNEALKNKIQVAAAKAALFLNAHVRPDQKKYISPILETRLRREEWQTVAEWIKPYFDGWTFVWNPEGGSPGLPQPPAEVSEGHGPTPKFSSRCIANNDGSAPPDGDYAGFLRKYSNCELACAWAGNDNCINRGQVGFIDPRKRDCKDTAEFKAMGVGLRQAQIPVMPPPDWDLLDDLSLVGCSKVFDSSDGAGGFIWKSSHVAEYNNVAILFPARFGRFASVQIQKQGNLVGKVEYAKCEKPPCGFPDQAAGNALRPIWRTEKNSPIEKYPYNVAIRGRTAEGKTLCWKVENPKERND